MGRYLLLWLLGIPCRFSFWSTPLADCT